MSLHRIGVNTSSPGPNAVVDLGISTVMLGRKLKTVKILKISYNVPMCD
jgi:hypothetical protein